MRRFLALSRSKHGIVDAAMPGFVALLWLGHFPSWRVLGLSLLTALAGYTAIYALNDLVGVKADREKFAGAGINSGYAVEASAMRHPLAQNLLGMRSGVAWFVFWYALTLVGAHLLNPALVIIVIAAALLEAIYCLLLKVTCWRAYCCPTMTSPSRSLPASSTRPPRQSSARSTGWKRRGYW